MGVGTNGAPEQPGYSRQRGGDEKAAEPERAELGTQPQPQPLAQYERRPKGSPGEARARASRTGATRRRWLTTATWLQPTEAEANLAGQPPSQ
jgi:hypothetical protein